MMAAFCQSMSRTVLVVDCDSTRHLIGALRLVELASLTAAASISNVAADFREARVEQSRPKTHGPQSRRRYPDRRNHR